MAGCLLYSILSHMANPGSEATTEKNMDGCLFWRALLGECYAVDNTICRRGTYAAFLHHFIRLFGVRIMPTSAFCGMTILCIH